MESTHDYDNFPLPLFYGVEFKVRRNKPRGVTWRLVVEKFVEGNGLTFEEGLDEINVDQIWVQFSKTVGGGKGGTWRLWVK